MSLRQSGGLMPCGLSYGHRAVVPGRGARAAQTRTLAGLKTPESPEDRHSFASTRDCRHQRRLSRRYLVEEQVLFGREVVVDRLLGDVRRGCNLGDRHVVEAAFGEQLHGPVGDLLPRAELLRLAQAHAPSVTQFL